MKATVTPHVIDPDVAIGEDHSTNSLIFKHYQDIPDDFISDLKSGKMDSVNQRSGEFMPTMSIPVCVIEAMKRDYGFDAMEEPQRRTAIMLRALGLDVFILTNKSF